MKVNVESEAKGIAIVTIDNKPMNALHPTGIKIYKYFYNN